MHSAIVVINMPEKHGAEGHHPKWVAYLADLSRASEPMVGSLERSGFPLGVNQTARLLRSRRSHDQRNRGSFYVPTEVRQRKTSEQGKTAPPDLGRRGLFEKR